MTTDVARRSWPRLVRSVLLLALGQAFLVAIYLCVERGRDNGETGRFRAERLDGPAPALAMMRPDGTMQSLAELRGRPVLLHFWATWCAPCRVELPKLLELGRELTRDGQGSVVAVVVDDDWPAVRRFFGAAIPPEVVALKADVAQRLYDVSTLPDTYLIDAEGTLRLRFRGARDWQDPAARAMVTRPHDEPASSPRGRP